MSTHVTAADLDLIEKWRRMKDAIVMAQDLTPDAAEDARIRLGWLVTRAVDDYREALDVTSRDVAGARMR